MTNENIQEKDVLVEVKDLCKYFNVGGGKLKAVDGISFKIYKGETLGLVGESGCGKSTTGRTMLRLYEPTSGEMLYNGKNIYGFSKSEMKEARKNMQMIFQDPYASLDPRMTVEQIVGEPFDIYGTLHGKKRKERVIELLDIVGLSAEHAQRFPHEFSGGQRQRIGIARALAVNPKFIVADEAVSALDVSIQSQIINLMQELKEDRGLTYLFISHDLGVVRYLSDRIAVMYLGDIVELATTDNIFNHTAHPYTEALLEAIPTTEVETRGQIKPLDGDVPSPVNPPSGCKFHTRCKYATEKCKTEVPAFNEISEGHFVACHYPLSGE